MRTAAFINLKGGVGKTVSAANVAHILAAVHRKRVLLVDGDKQGNNHNLYQMLFNGERLVRQLKKVIREKNRKEKLTWTMYLEQRARRRSLKQRETPTPT